jgi:MFS family permease
MSSNSYLDRKSKFFYGYVVVAAALLIMVISIGALYSFGIFLKPVLTEFGWTRAATSGAYSLCILFIAFLGIVMGRLNDRFGPRIVVSFCGLLLGCGYLLMSQVSAIWQLYLFYGTLVGIGASGTLVPPISTIARWFVKRRGLMTGIAMSGIGLGTTIVPPLANWIISSFGWRYSYTILGIAVLVLMIPIAQFLRRDPSQIGLMPYSSQEQEKSSPKTTGLSLQGAIRTPQFWMIATIFLFFGVTVQTIIVHIVPHATDIGISTANAANILAIIGGISIAGRVIMGNAGDRIGNKLNSVICFTIMLVALFWLLITEDVWAFYLFAIVFGFGYGGMSTVSSPIAAELFGMASHGVILGTIFCGMAIGETIGPTLAGYIFDNAGSYQLAFLISVGLSITAVILASLLKAIRS